MDRHSKWRLSRLTPHTKHKVELCYVDTWGKTVCVCVMCRVCCVSQALRDGLAAAGLAAKVIYSGGIDVDILAQVGLTQV